jgi:hypothetical protein
MDMGKHKRFFLQFASAGGLLLAVFMLFAACPLEDLPPEQGAALDERLYGVWRYEYGSIMEEFRITREPRNAANAGALITGSKIWEEAGFRENFAGDIVYSENFSESSGIIIVEYWPGREQLWVDWGKAAPPYHFPPREDSPVGKNFFGVYFYRMNEAGNEVFLALTSDQKNNNGPTETETLEEAIAKFSRENMGNLLNLSVGDPQHKVE